MPVSSSASFPIALAQINPIVGDLTGNAQKIIQFAQQAHGQRAQLVLTPELSLCGYPPEDLLLRPAFMQACTHTLLEIAQTLAPYEGLHVVVGHPYQPGPQADLRSRSIQVQMRFNAASVLSGGRIVTTYCKRELPNYQVFDERRYFASGREAEAPAGVFEVQGVRFGLLICEDAWFDEPGQLARSAGAQVLCVLNASPFHAGKIPEREGRMSERARHLQMPLLYAHLCGGQDEVVFDGASFALNAQGEVVSRASLFQEELALINLCAQSGQIELQGQVKPVPPLVEQIWQALVVGVRDYIGKNGFSGVLIGLSGGIDSALVLAVAVDALGADKVRAVMMPSPYTASMSWVDAREMAQGLGVRYDEIGITALFEEFKNSLSAEFRGLKEDTTEENLQARIRGTLLMALSNKFGSIVLTTGNKSELATGYCTLYGDMAGGFAVIKDVAKTRVYQLARWRNEQAGQPVIPERIITRPPSAELRPDQTDQDSLPPYEILDAILEGYMENDQSIESLVQAGFDRTVVERVTRLIKINEYKRRQSPVGVRITHRAFGRDWRYPITSKFLA
jgi:NAD+ synthase (glutamine-hydrolysing)